MIRVMVAEDMRILREALVGLLALESDIEVVAEVGSGDEIVGTALKFRPDVAILDIELPKVDGLTAAAQLQELLPECRSLVLTGVGRPPFAGMQSAYGVVRYRTTRITTETRPSLA